MWGFRKKMIKIEINTEYMEKKVKAIKIANQKIQDYIDELTTPKGPLYGWGFGKWCNSKLKNKKH